jgi:perosamine synthetase
MGFGEVAPTAGLAPRLRDLVTGPAPADALEAAICTLFALPDIEFVSTGTAALRVAFLALKRRRPQRTTVIVPGYTCPLVVIAAHAAGLSCIACDTVSGGFDLDLGHLARLVDARTLCVVPTHFGGILADVAAVRAALPADVAVVEDAAQAFGATWAGVSTGLAGDIGIYSFGAGKGFTLYEGGAVTARDPALMQAMREVLAEVGRPSATTEFMSCVGLVGYHAFYTPGGLALVYGAPKRRALAAGDDIAAAGDAFDLEIDVRPVGRWRKAVGLAALQRMPAHIQASQRRFDELAQTLDRVPQLKVHRPPAHARPLCTYVFATLPDSPRTRETIAQLWRSRLGVAKLFSRAIGDYPYLQPLLHPSETPRARALAATTFTVSTHSGLSSQGETAIVAALLRGST